ncbi:hypothetical protein DPM19_33590 [Actinomadura craniellae]|uniref:Plasmid mobilization relaxosome protein MobC n=1 Tax=Actinomadura craniellae TaxID=2231787 RepID=A0A365GVB2_9ACTN|nr:hypothetical protein [Actinomadura craniellae]RAY10735.1 hypothetical protein DPM19_33590 [Actinomadura craniellae]
MRFVLSAEEYTVLTVAAEREGLANGAYAAQAALAAAQGDCRSESAPLRELLGALMQASGQVRRAGVNLNQAVVALHAGELSSALRWYADATYRSVRKLDEIADEVRLRLP